MKHKYLHKLLAGLLTFTLLFSTDIIFPAIHSEAAETLTFEDELAVSSFLKSNPQYYNGHSLNTVGGAWVYDASNNAVHLKDGVYSPTRTNSNPRDEGLTGIGSQPSVNISQDYDWDITKQLSEGKHLYNYEMQAGDIMPVSSWRYYTTPTAVHHYQHMNSIGTFVGSNSVGDWYKWCGVEFLNDTVGNPSCDVKNAKWYETANYTKNPVTGKYSFGAVTCTENYVRTNTQMSTTIYDYPAWMCICSICGEPLTNVFFECPANCLSGIKYVEIGTHVITKCRGCGALENEGYTGHICEAVSDNRYYIKYDDGTKDPAVYGTVNNTIFYANNANKYEGQSVIYVPVLKNNKFVRPGYTFAGWSLADDGTPDYAAGADIYTLDFYSTKCINNNDTVTLYACWAANPSTVIFDTETNNIWGNGASSVKGVTNYSVTNTIHVSRVAGKDNKTLDNAGNFTNNTVTINASDIVTPKGCIVSFNSSGSSAAPITETTKITGYTKTTNSDEAIEVDGVPLKNVSASYDSNGYLTKITYSFLKAPCTETITFSYEKQGIILPTSSKSGQLFVGWYTTSDFKDGTFVGSAGDYYYPTNNITLYARFSQAGIEITDAYYHTGQTHTFANLAKKNGVADNSYSEPTYPYAVNYATGALNVKVSLFAPAGTTIAYKTFYKQSAVTEWTAFDGSSTSAGNAIQSVDKTFPYVAAVSATNPADENGFATQTYKVLSTGYYKLTALGGQGESFANATVHVTGNAGDEVSGQVYLKTGETITITVGRMGDQSVATAIETGGYTSIYKTDLSGNKVLLMTAAGGTAEPFAIPCGGHISAHTSTSTCGTPCRDNGDRGDGVHTYSCPYHGVQFCEWPWAHANRWCGVVTGSSTFYSCDVCGTRYSNASGTCTKLNANVTTITHPYDVENYFNPAYVISGNINIDKQYGPGKVVIKSVIVGLKDGNDASTEILGIKTADLAAPDAVVVTKTEPNGVPTLTWEEPNSNGTNYDVKFAEYEVTTEAADGLRFVTETDTYTKKVTSAIAGYYYYYSNSNVMNLGSYITSGLGWKSSFTTDFVNATVMKKDDKLFFTDARTLTIASNSYSYINIAAVDVAGNIGPTTSIETLKTNVGTVIFNNNPPKYYLNRTSVLKTVSQYYAIAGTNVASNGKGFDGTTSNLTFGAAFPVVTLDSCVFLGWNSNPDGKGTWYSKAGTGTGLTSNSPKTLVISDITGEKEAGQSITLYAIWNEIVTDTTQLEFVKNTITVTDNGVKVVPSTVRSFSPAWSTEGKIIINSTAPTGPYTIATNMYDYLVNGTPISASQLNTSTRRGELIYYTAGSSPANTYYDLLSDTRMNSGSTDIENESLYHSSFELKESLLLQGSFRVKTTVTSREGNTASDSSLVVKIDNTPVKINSYSIEQDSLQNYTEPELLELIANNGGLSLNTVFNVHASDYASAINGNYTNKADTSGIKGVYITFYSDTKTVTKQMSLKSTIAKTASGESVVDGNYTLSIDLPKEFPADQYVSYRVEAIDNAGCVGETVFVSDMVCNDFDGSDQFEGILNAFDIVTYIYNNSPGDYTLATGEEAFLLGDEARVVTYTIGYAESVSFDFHHIGEECADYIAKGMYELDFNMGIPRTGYTREYRYDSANATKVTSTNADVNGVPYASKYEFTTRIFPFIDLNDAAFVTENYTASANKLSNGTVMNVLMDRTYYIFASEDDIHYRSY